MRVSGRVVHVYVLLQSFLLYKYSDKHQPQSGFFTTSVHINHFEVFLYI